MLAAAFCTSPTHLSSISHSAIHVVHNQKSVSVPPDVSDGLWLSHGNWCCSQTVQKPIAVMLPSHSSPVTSILVHNKAERGRGVDAKERFVVRLNGIDRVHLPTCRCTQLVLRNLLAQHVCHHGIGIPATWELVVGPVLWLTC